MKSIAIFFSFLLGACAVASAQVVLTSDNYFPADLEFRELRQMLSEESFEDPALLSKVEDGRLVQDVGFDRYARRNYSVEKSGKISVEIFTLKDARAAYSLLTLLRDSPIQNAAPGNAHTIQSGLLRFAQGRRWVRIRGTGVSEDLTRRIALSISNRMGSPQSNAPSLISHLPKSGFDVDSLRYFPGLDSFRSYAGESEFQSLNLVSDAEIARAQYRIGDRSATLLLFHFPTGPVAEDYFDSIDALALPVQASGEASYAKRSGPLVALLRGAVDPAAADRFLGSLRYSYSIRWIFEKKTKILWGIPTTILGTVVKSVFFVAFLGVVSILAGAGFAFLRFALRTRHSKNAPDSPDEADIIRLRLR